jgi:hypothetical protein
MAMPKEADEDLRGGALFEPLEAGFGIRTGGCAASLSAVAEGFRCPVGQNAPLAAPARTEPVLKSASGAGAADINAEASATAQPSSSRQTTLRSFRQDRQVSILPGVLR